MAIKQGRYITADTTGKKEMAIRTTELDKVKDDPFVRRSEVQQTVNNSTLPVSSRAVNLFLSSYASITYVDDKFNSIDLSKYLTIENANQTYSTKTELTKKWDVQETIGSGKVMREGAYGFGANLLNATVEQIDLSDLQSVSRNSFILVSPDQNEINTSVYERVMGVHFKSGIVGNRYSGFLINEQLSPRAFIYNNRGGGSFAEIYHDLNTTSDKNGVLHKGTSTPINTLNVSDMADTVVDNDEITVTSGAVYRAIGQLMDQISRLEARLEELEDGGA